MTLARKYSKYNVPQQFVEMLLLQNSAVATERAREAVPPAPQRLLVPPHFDLLK